MEPQRKGDSKQTTTQTKKVKASEDVTEPVVIGDNDLEPWDDGVDPGSDGHLSPTPTNHVASSQRKCSVSIADNAGFPLKAIVISSSPLKRRKLLMMKPTPAFPLLNLPAEIRTMVYTFVLKEDIPLSLARSYDPTGSRRVIRYRSCDQNSQRCLSWAPLREKWVDEWIDQQPSSASLINVNRQLHQEASPVLYGENRFLFDSTTVLRDFLKDIGTSGRHLKHIILPSEAYFRSNVRSALRRLSVAKGLRTLEFPCHLFMTGLHSSRPHSVESLAADCKTLLKGLQKFHKNLDLAYSVLDIVQVRSSHQMCADCKQSRHRPKARWPISRQKVIKNCAAHQKDFRTIVASYLGMVEEE